MSKAIIRPSTMPSRMADPPFMLFRPSVSELMSEDSGLASTTIIRKPPARVVTNGMITTGIRPRTNGGTGRWAIQWAIRPAIAPPTMPPRKPAPMTELAR